MRDGGPCSVVKFGRSVGDVNGDVRYRTGEVVVTTLVGLYSEMEGDLGNGMWRSKGEGGDEIEPERELKDEPGVNVVVRYEGDAGAAVFGLGDSWAFTFVGREVMGVNLEGGGTGNCAIRYLVPSTELLHDNPLEVAGRPGIVERDGVTGDSTRS